MSGCEGPASAVEWAGMNRPGANLSEFFNGILNVRFASSERRGFRDVEVQALGNAKLAPAGFRGDLANEDAANYLRAIILASTDHARRAAARGYSRYRWLWYLRRTPSQVFAGELRTTEPYDRSLAEILATTGAPRQQGRFEGIVDMPTDDAAARQIVRQASFARAVSHLHSLYRWAGKGATLRFNGSPIPSAIKTPELAASVKLYDQRSALENNWATRLGTILPNDVKDPNGEQFAGIVVREDRKYAVSLRELGISRDGMIEAGYTPASLPLSALAHLLSEHPLSDRALWHPELGLLLQFLSLTPWLVSSAASQANILATGYALVRQQQLAERIQGRIQERTEALAFALPQFVYASSAAELIERVSALEPQSWPRTAGPVILEAGEDAIAVDLWSATERLYNRLQYPSLQGEVANLRAKHFEAAVQEVVDRSSWRPSAAFRQYVGRHLRQNGRELTDIDAIAERNGVVLLISCKSVLPNEAFERGDYRELRNAVTTIVDGTKKYRALADVIRTAPRGDNFDFSAAQSIHFVLVTPSTIHVPQAVGERIALNGLREYSTVEELRQWLDADDRDAGDRLGGPRLPRSPDSH